MQSNANTLEEEVTAVTSLNRIKEELARSVRYLNDLKYELTNDMSVEQGEKSRVRIQIESLLIDLNEQVYTTSEALANAFSSRKPSPSELTKAAQVIEQRKIYLMGKLKQCIV